MNFLFLWIKMSSESQETSKNADFLAFNSRNSGENQNVRNNYQYRPYNRNWNQQNHNFRRDQFMGGPRNDGNTQFTPPDHSSPVGGYQQRYDRVFRGRHMNQYQNQRHFTPYKVSFLFVSSRLLHFLSKLSEIHSIWLWPNIWFRFNLIISKLYIFIDNHLNADDCNRSWSFSCVLRLQSSIQWFFSF